MKATFPFSSRTAEGFDKTFVIINVVQYLANYFEHIGEDGLFSEIKVQTLGTRHIEGLFGHISEKIQGNKPTFLSAVQQKSRNRGLPFCYSQCHLR